MKSPQTEDGFTQIANELLEAFSKLDASGSAWRVFMVVLRKTYGFHKKKDKISLTQFEEMSALTRKSVCRGLKELIELKIITVEKEGYINMYQVQKDYNLWGSVKPVTSDKNDTGSSVKLDTKSSVRNDTYKRKKDNKDIGEKISQVISPIGIENMSWPNKQNDNDSDLPDIDMDSREEIKVVGKPKRHYKEIYAVFKDVYGETPPDWAMNTTEQKSAEILFEVKGVEKVKRALLFYEENRDHEFCPKIYSPTSLNRKWQPLFDFKEKFNL